MIGKKMEKNNLTTTLNVLYAKKNKKYILPISKHNLNHKKASHTFDDSKQRRMALNCSKKTICIIKKNNVKIPR